MATVAAGCTAAAGVDVADLDDRTARCRWMTSPPPAVDVVAVAVDVVADAAGLDGGALAGEDVAGVGAVVVVADHVAVDRDVRGVDVAVRCRC